MVGCHDEASQPREGALTGSENSQPRNQPIRCKLWQARHSFTSLWSRSWFVRPTCRVRIHSYIHSTSGYSTIVITITMNLWQLFWLLSARVELALGIISLWLLTGYLYNTCMLIVYLHGVKERLYQYFDRHWKNRDHDNLLFSYLVPIRHEQVWTQPSIHAWYAVRSSSYNNYIWVEFSAPVKLLRRKWRNSNTMWWWT